MNPRYDAVFLDVDGTLLWVDLDVEGYVRDLAAYAHNGELTLDTARGPVWESMRRHIEENIEHRTEEGLAEFKLRNARATAQTLGIDAPSDVLLEVSERRILFNPYPESEPVLTELKAMALPVYVVSNWDLLLERVLDDLGWLDLFDGVVASAVVGAEKPDPRIFDAALDLSGAPRDRVVHVGNDPVTDVEGATRSGIDAVYIDRKGEEAPGAVMTMPDLSGLPLFVRGG